MGSGPVALLDIAGLLPRGGTVYVQGCSGESAPLAERIAAAGEPLSDITFTGIFVPGLNRNSYLVNSTCTTRTFFMTPELRRRGEQVDFLPLDYAGISAHLRHERIDAAVFTVSPPDAEGRCSFGTTVDFLAELWPRIGTRIAHVNPSMPRTTGSTSIPFDALTAFVDADQPLPGHRPEPPDDAATSIARHVAAFIVDGATLQTGLGKIPGAVLRALAGRRDLRIHSGLIGDAVLDLVDAGALSGVTAGVAIGSALLYEAVADPLFRFEPVSYTHSTSVIAAIKDFTAINSAFEVDLFGQAYAEVGPAGLTSGPGGASDFARGAKAAGGLRIIALPAGSGDSSRIVLPGDGRGPVSLGRMDVDVVVTEHGAADLRERSHDSRAQALIEIAPPDHRQRLHDGWREYGRHL